MFIPNKHENLQKSTIVLGANIISALNKKTTLNIEDLFQELKKEFPREDEKEPISLNQYYNTLTFLWLSELINLDEFTLTLKNNVS